MRWIAIIALSLGLLLPANAAVVNLPIEIVGGNGATASVAVEIPAAQVRRVASLWMQIHNSRCPSVRDSHKRWSPYRGRAGYSSMVQTNVRFCVGERRRFFYPFSFLYWTGRAR